MADDKDKPFLPPSITSSLDASRADRAVWLLKVPPRVSQSWQQYTEPGTTMAKVLLSLDPTKPADSESAMQFSLELSAKDATGIYKGYSLNLTKDVVPMHIFSETPPGKLAVEGKVEKKFDMKPNDLSSDEYRKVCRERLDKSRIKTRTVQVLENDHGVFIRPSPVAVGPMYALKKKGPVTKAPEAKRIRIERGELEDMVFKLFEQQPFWAFKQLVVETQQPEAFLKEVTNDLCVYNKRGPNQGKYELKPEYIRKPTEEEKPAE